MALLEAAKKFDPSFGTKLLTYTTPAMESAMADYGAQASLSLSIPSSRYDQLRKVAHLYAEAEESGSENTIVDVIREAGGVPKGSGGAAAGISDAVLRSAVGRRCVLYQLRRRSRQSL